MRRRIRLGPRTNIRREREAWSVIVVRKRQPWSGYFGDAVWGGRRLALVAAQRFRDELLQRIEPDTRVRSAPGVGVVLETYQVGGRTYQRYLAHWQDPKKGTQRKKFSVRRYGEEKARVLAEEARREGVARAAAYWSVLQREAAARRLAAAPPMPKQVKDPLSRKGISMARRRPRSQSNVAAATVRR